MSLVGVVAIGFGSAACGSVGNNPTIDASSSQDDAAHDAAQATGCDLSKPFGTPTLVDNVNTSNDETGFATTRDGLNAFMRSGSSNAVATRGSASVSFGASSTVQVAAINAQAGNNGELKPTSDGLILYYFHQDPATGDGLIFETARANAQAAFPAGTVVSVDLASLNNAIDVVISDDGQTLYWLAFNDFSMHAADRQDPKSFMNSRSAATFTMDTGSPTLSADELTLFYAGGVINNREIFVTTRNNKMAPFTPGVAAAELNSPKDEFPAAVSHDGCTIYLYSNRAGGIGGFDIYEAHRPAAR